MVCFSCNAYFRVFYGSIGIFTTSWNLPRLWLRMGTDCSCLHHCLPTFLSPLLLLFGNCGLRTCFPFSGLGLPAPLNLHHLHHSKAISLFALQTLLQITTTTLLVRTYTKAPLTSLPLKWRSYTTYRCPISMRRSYKPRSQPQSGRPTSRKRHI